VPQRWGVTKKKIAFEGNGPAMSWIERGGVEAGSERGGTVRRAREGRQANRLGDRGEKKPPYLKKEVRKESWALEERALSTVHGGWGGTPWQTPGSELPVVHAPLRGCGSQGGKTVFTEGISRGRPRKRTGEGLRQR